MLKDCSVSDFAAERDLKYLKTATLHMTKLLAAV